MTAGDDAGLWPVPVKKCKCVSYRAGASVVKWSRNLHSVTLPSYRSTTMWSTELKQVLLWGIGSVNIVLSERL